MTIQQERQLLSGNEAMALGALHAGIQLGTGYPGTPSTEILENFDRLGGKAQWAPNEKVALEVGIGSAYSGARTLVTMKHVGVNVAADPLFTVAYTGVQGALVMISADDPGMASSQNEQDNRHYAKAAGVMMLEPSSSQEAYDYMRAAVELSERWKTMVMLRVTTRVCHSKSIVVSCEPAKPGAEPSFERDIPTRVMIPAYARPAHRRLRERLKEIAQWNNGCDLNQQFGDDARLGIVTSGIAASHVLEAVPDAKVLKLGLTWPLPMEKIRDFAAGVSRLVVVEEGDPWLAENLRAAGIECEDKPEMYRFGELSVMRVRRILAGDTSPEPIPPRGKPPQLCTGCPHRTAFTVLGEMGCIVTGDIGCYTLGVLPPFEAMDTCVCMGASIGVGLGMRHVLPPDQARKVVSVIGDSTFMHSGVSGLIEMVYNRPPTGHLVIILDNGTTAMTGLQEHPGTGRSLGHEPAYKVDFEGLVKSLGMEHVETFDPSRQGEAFENAISEALASDRLTVLIARRPCLLAAPKIIQYDKAAAEAHACECGHSEAENASPAIKN